MTVAPCGQHSDNEDGCWACIKINRRRKGEEVDGFWLLVVLVFLIVFFGVLNILGSLH